MSTIRERVAEFDALTKAHPDERYMCLSVAADRHALLAAGDALAEAVWAYLEHLNVEQGPDNSDQMLTWAMTDYRLVEALGPALAAREAVAG